MKRRKQMAHQHGGQQREKQQGKDLPEDQQRRHLHVQPGMGMHEGDDSRYEQRSGKID